MKTTVSLNVSGTSLQALVDDALLQLRTFHSDGEWSIDEVNVWSSEATADEEKGEVTVWRGEIKASTSVDLTS